jgi:hypothetical protein
MEKNIQDNIYDLLISLKKEIKKNDFLATFEVYKQLKLNNCSVKLERNENDDEGIIEDNNIIYNNKNNNIKKENDDLNFSIFQ